MLCCTCTCFSYWLWSWLDVPKSATIKVDECTVHIYWRTLVPDPSFVIIKHQNTVGSDFGITHLERELFLTEMCTIYFLKSSHFNTSKSSSVGVINSTYHRVGKWSICSWTFLAIMDCVVTKYCEWLEGVWPFKFQTCYPKLIYSLTNTMFVYATE